MNPDLPDLIKTHIGGKMFWNIPAKDEYRIGRGWGFGICWAEEEVASLIFRDAKIDLVGSGPALFIKSVDYTIDFHDPNSFEDFDGALKHLLGRCWRSKGSLKKAFFVFWFLFYLFVDVKILIFSASTWIYIALMCYAVIAGINIFLGAIYLTMICAIGFQRFKEK